ncbi:MAG: YraN family protein [Cyanobacteria bacterium J06634_5]
MVIHKPQDSASQDLEARNSEYRNSDAKKIGNLGEQLVSQWLVQKNCQILHRQWHSRFGEIDLIARGQSGQGSLRCEMLAFIEVKTRSQGNWDADGLLSVTRSKQNKLRTTARYFLVRHPYLSELPCRFDIALVSCHTAQSVGSPRGFLSLPVPNSNQYLRLQRYIRNAF